MKFLFRCDVCGLLTEVEGRVGESPRAGLCSCGGELKRRFLPLNVIYRGSGFYTTDKALYDE
jgi:predicted nucleic acid-binding Zn ribbon protein